MRHVEAQTLILSFAPRLAYLQSFSLLIENPLAEARCSVRRTTRCRMSPFRIAQYSVWQVWLLHGEYDLFPTSARLQGDCPPINCVV